MKRLAVCLLLAASGGVLWHSRRERPSAAVSVHLPEAASSIPGGRSGATPAAPAPGFVRKSNVIDLRQDVRWQQPGLPHEPEFADFKTWADGFARGNRDEEDGIRLARERRVALVDLISKDPRRALELAVPETIRRILPRAVQAELEERVDGRGDLLVAATVALRGGESRLPAVTRTVTISGREFETYTYGNRESAMSRRSLAIHGIALDGKLAMSEWPARVLEPVEAAEARAKPAAPPLCPVSGAPLDGNGDEVVLDFSLEETHWYCQAAHATQELLAAAAAEAALPPGVAAGGIGGGGAEVPKGDGSYTTGVKKMLLIRVDFPDKTGPAVSDATLNALITNMGAHWSDMSFGSTTWALPGEGSAITPTLRLPNGHAHYTSLASILTAARAAAEDAGYDYHHYDFEIVVTGDKPDVGFAGVAYVGERGAWLANGQWNPGVCSHEAGHNFGLNHSGFWAAADGTTTGPGTNMEYGNPFDHMGSASASTSAHFNARQKHFLGWIPDAGVRKVSTDSTVTQRLSAMDRSDADGVRTLTVDRDGTAQDYWIEYRTLYSANMWMKDGVMVNFGDVTISNGKPSLLDFTPGTVSRDDCPLLTGKTFSDREYGIHITPTARGTGPDGVPWMEVTVNRGAFSGNRRPSVALNFSPANPAVGESADFTVAASDPDGDALSYFWDWGDGEFTANNAPAASHFWISPGIKTVRCTVSDMKGLTATASALVQAGAGSTFFISGHVRTAGGLPFEGVTVSAGGKSDLTDSEGFFAITGLGTGSYTVSATKTNYSFDVSGFTNPVTIGPGKTDANFIAPAGSPVFGLLKPALLNAGGSTGAIFLPLSDNDTSVTAMTLTAVSSNRAVIPDANITFGSGDPRSIAVSAPGGVSGAVDITIRATDPENNSNTYTWPVTVNAPPVLVPAVQTAAENAFLDIDLREFVSDDHTPDSALAFRMDRARNGTVQLLPDGHTARFTPAPGYHGPASFRLTARDRSLSSRTLLLYDFEPGSGIELNNGEIADLSNFNRTGTIESVGNGEFSAVADVPAALSPHSTAALSLTENGGGGAAGVKRAFTASELDWNDSDWTFCAWVKRSSTGSEDVVFHLGDGDGHGPEEELELYFPAGSHELRLEKHSAAGIQANMMHPAVPAGEWHCVGITFDRTAAGAGTLSLYVDGFAAGSVAGVGMAVNQSRSAVIGGHADPATALTRWLDGRLDDVMIAGSVLSGAELRGLATTGASHHLGLSAAGTVNITITGTNDAPVILSPGDAGMEISTPVPLPFKVSDAESEFRTLTVTGGSSNPAVIPASGISISAAPSAWTSTGIGPAGVAGDTIEDHGTFLISGGGAGIGGTEDAFRFVCQEVSGNAELICRVLSLDCANAGSRAGLMLRTGTGADAPFAMMAVTAGEGVAWSSRTAAGANAESAPPVNFIAAPVWLRLVRSGATVSGYFALDQNGAPGAWQSAGGITGFSLPAVMKAGLAVTGSGEASPATATVEHAGGSLTSGGERVVTLTPAAGQSGDVTITLRVSDGVADTTATFRAFVGVNTPPTVSAVPDITVAGGQLPSAFTVTVGDLQTPAASLTLTGTSSNAPLLPDNRIVITGSGAQRTVQLRPVPGETGATEIILTVSEGMIGDTVRFTLTVTPGDPSLLISAGTNWRYLDNGTAPANWKTPAFNDSAWPRGPAQLGFGDGDEETRLTANTTRKTTYFRRSFQLADPALYEWLQLNVLRDDGAVIHLNGQEIQRTNMPEGIAITSATDALTAVDNADESRFYPFTLRHPPFVAGTNVIAVEVHQKGAPGTDLSFDLEARGLHPSPIEAVPAGAVWTYLDTGADPGNGWTSVSYVDAAWKTGPAQLGYGDGDEATVIEGGPDHSHYITTWFRKRFDLTDTTDLAGIGLRVLRDDGIQVWLNDQPLYRNNLPAATDASTLALTAIDTSGERNWQTIWLPPDLLLPGPNQLAAEIHQSSLTSTDISFDLQLLLYTRDALPPLNATAAGANVILSWPQWAAAWRLQSSPDMNTWTPETGSPSAEANGLILTLPRTAARKYFRLALP